MSSEHDAQDTRKRTPHQSSFSRALEKLSSIATLTLFKEKAKKVVGEAPVYICSSTGIDDKEKLFFAVKKKPDEGEEDFTRLGKKFEKLHGLSEWMVVEDKSGTPQFSRMYKNLTLLAPDNLQNVQAFVEQCKAEETQLASGSKKPRK
ncbi:MAG TPA: hypothetical protein VGV92_08450 [Gammaproteobacteria bacterium]|nr:hypothetical protein [Gammaproteobacteria bacterium]